MENDRRFTRSSFQQRGNPQLAILTHLVQVSSTMEHIDEMFLWLASAMVQQLEVQLLQIWALQAFSTRQIAMELRASFSEDSSLPQYLVNNIHITEVVGNFLRRRRGLPQQPVSNYFSPHQTNLFLRYGLNYCFGHYLSSETLLPPRLTPSSPLAVTTPYSIMALLFTRNASSQNLFSTTIHILIPVAGQHAGTTVERRSAGSGTTKRPPARMSIVMRFAKKSTISAVF